MLSEYRQRFSDFHTELHREDYLFRSGHKQGREIARIRSEYSDLFKPSTVAELGAKLEETSEQRETERSSVKRLIAFAVEGALLARAQEVSGEIEAYEANALIDWQGRKVPFRASASALADESDFARRRDLYARRAGVIEATQDLRAERLEKLRVGARELGYENRLAMIRELRGLDYEGLAERTRGVLSKTESGYVNALASLLPRETGVSIDDATQADLGILRRFARFDHFFPRERMLGVYRELFAALGFNSEKQSNLAVDSEPRPGKRPQAFCSPIRVPDEIKLSVNLTGGQANYRELLREAGHAQLYAWTSRNLYPEFRVAGDRAVVEAWGLLFNNLALDERWLMATFGFVENMEFRRALAVFRLMSLRQRAALLDYEIGFHSGGGEGARYAELMTDAAHVRFDGGERLRSLDDALHSADFLRASAFEAQMREYLKTHFGVRWWASRKAGETLIDLWNAGRRYTVEELASMIGLGALDFDWLASELLESMEGRSA
jgi:transcriptional regulator with XRE-family HTH domain